MDVYEERNEVDPQGLYHSFFLIFNLEIEIALCLRHFMNF